MYRCLVIYYYNWLIIIVPVILWVANFVCYTLAVYVTATQKSDAILNVSSLKPFLLAGMATSAVGSMLSTGSPSHLTVLVLCLIHFVLP